ncbi:hypothetical protein BDW02DRAFT_579488 [Decorospora gaudefroyi]|uniref:Uncharacterized protein n=1 Tax=Decorospora gaudefroyi TaxID=184978 RepID=A0A6A5KM30_9PLEO|nr:hypothetical protein BDW02DRAFT_579488 [Decorospora gaudefroyi]
MYSLTTILITILFLATASTALPTYPNPVICGNIKLANGRTQLIYRDSCTPIMGKALSATVYDSCACEFSQWDTCNAGKRQARSITGVPITEAKGYWCNPA